MVKKKSSGDYECQHCGKKYVNYKDAIGHESVCSESELSNFLGDEIGKIAGLKTPEFDSKETGQLTIGESYIGKCPLCDAEITSSDRYRDKETFFECPNCQKVVRK